MKAWIAVAFAVILALPLPSPPAQAAGSGAPLEWWGAKGIDEGFHMRVPVTVTNPHPFPVVNGPVAVELDLAQKLVAAGWTTAAGGDRDVLTGFRLDAASIRVVSMTNLQTPADNVNGRLKVADPSFPAGDERRYELPSLHIEGSLHKPGRFDASVDPLVTVLWRVPGALQPNEERAFVVYFDSDRTSEAKQPRVDDLTFADGDLRGLFWSGPTLTAFGYVAAVQGGAGRIQVSSLHAATRFTVYISPVGPSGSLPAPMQPLPGGNTFDIADAFGTLQVPVSTTGPVAVKVVATKPVIVQGASAGFVPSLDGGMTGREFLFYTMDAAFDQDVLYVKAVDPRDDNGVLEPTEVEVVALGTGKKLVYQTGEHPNDFDYVVSPRAAMTPTGASSCRGGGASPFLAPGTNVQQAPPALYRARVLSGERVTLQVSATTGLAQVPSTLGAPAGTEFWPAGPWSDDLPGIATMCGQVTTRPALWMASAKGGATAGTITSPELSYQVSPPGTPSPPGPPSGAYPAPHPIPASPAYSAAAAITGRAAADRPLLLATGGETFAFAGTNPTSGQPPIHGPFGGDDAGRSFSGVGRALAYAPFAGTSLGIQSTYAQGSASAAPAISTASFVIIDDASASNPVRSFRLESNRPVLVVPASASTTYFPGVPAMLAAETGPAEYRGYLLDLSSERGLDPLTGSTPPGVPLQQTLQLSNRAHALDGTPLPDLVKLVAQVPAGWSATLEGIQLSPTQGPTLSLAGGETESLTFVVSPPVDLASGKSGTVTVHAVSQNNERVQDTLDVVTFVKTVFDVGVWFDAIGGAKEQENRTMSPAGLANFTLIVQNQGSKPETVRLLAKFKAGETTWLARLGGADGGPVVDLPLAARQSVPIRLTLKAPPGLVDGEATVVVTAEVVGVSNSQDAVQATGARRAPADLLLEADGLTRVVDPGQDATFNLTIRNRGQGAANVLLGSRAGPQPSWGPPRVLVAGVQTPDVAVDPGSAVRVQVVARAGPAGLAGDASTIRFSARPEGTSSGAMEAVLTALVRAMHDLDATFPGLPAILAPGGNTTVGMRVSNQGNLDEQLLVRPADLPPGWRVSADDEVLLPRGATALVRLNITVPAGAPAIQNKVSVDLIALDGNVTTVEFPVEVALGAGPTSGVAQGLRVQPGRPARIEIPVGNDGNTPLVVTANPVAGEPWQLVAPPQLRLLPGERSALPLAWQVPATAPAGAALHRATLSFQSEGLDGQTTKAVEAMFDVGRADLAVARVASATGPAGKLIHTEVENRGDRPAFSFLVTLFVDDEAVDQVTVGELAPGETVELALVQVRAGVAHIDVDSNATVVEANEENNVQPVATMPADAAPVGPWGLVALAVAVALVRRRGR